MKILLAKIKPYLSAFTLLTTLGLAVEALALEPRPIPDYRVRLLGSDQAISIADLAGQAVLLNTWATWCPPCRAEMPDFETIHQRYRDQGLAVVGVNIDEGQADAEVTRYVQGLGVSFAIWRDPHNRFSKRFRSLGVPETFLIDRKGMIIHHWQGPMNPNAPENLKLIQAALDSHENNPPAQPESSVTAKRGKRLAQQRGCLSCHSTDGTAGAGPTWKNLPNTEVKLTDGRQLLRDRAYLKRAIAAPDDEIVSGYSEAVMTGAMPGKPLTPDEIDALVLYLETL